MMWDSARLNATLEELRRFGDDTTLIECKTAAGGMRENIGSTLSAFANMPEGGTIILGVNEHADFLAVGVKDPAAMEKQVADYCRNVIEPAPQLIFDHVTLGSARIVIVTVNPLLPRHKPARFGGKAYLRQADGEYTMNPNDLRMIEISALHESERQDFDMRALPDTNTQMLDSKALARYKQKVRTDSRRLQTVTDDELLLQLTGVTTSDGELRMSGLYALGFLPQSVEPALGGTAAVRLSRTDDRKRHSNLVDFEGPLPELIEQTMAWIAQNTDTVSSYDKRGNLVDQPEFPPSAIREVVANAFVHRDLGPTLDVGKRVEVRLSKSALVIVNPGGLRGLSVAQLESRELAKAPVNQRLYTIAKHLETSNGARVVEGEGGGIREALIATQKARLQPPKFIDTGVQFKVIFPRGPRFSDVEQHWLQEWELDFSAPQEDIMVALRRGESYSYSRLRSEYSPLSESELHSEVDQLEKWGAITVTEAGFLLSNGEQRGAAGRPGALGALGKNVPAVYDAVVASPQVTVKDIIDRTGLTINQVRYALAPLLERGYVLMNGQQGARSTTYSVGNTTGNATDNSH